jgi:ribose 5-phosphate isomerase A
MKEPACQPFELVGAHRSTASASRELIERCLKPGEWSRAVGDVIGIVLDKISHQTVEFCTREHASVGRKPALDQRPSSPAHHTAGGSIGHGRKSHAAKNDIERADEVRCGIDQRAVEIENHDGSNHDVRIANPRQPSRQGLPMDVEAQKRAAAARAIEFVHSGMRIGLGTGSTAWHFVELLGERVHAGLDIVAVPTSEATKAQAERLRIPLTTLDQMPQLDLTIDGADEIAPDLSLIKGGGGALLREKIVASSSLRMVVIADQSKWVDTLGRFPLPIEVVPFGIEATLRKIESATGALGCAGPARLRSQSDGHAFVTDGGHWIVDLPFARIADPQSLAARLDGITGVVEHGLFVGLACAAVIAGAGGVRVVERS